jgi:hypothetical protein
VAAVFRQALFRKIVAVFFSRLRLLKGTFFKIVAGFFGRRRFSR